ncbi:MAG: glycerate kinase [Opitutales bacterium]
MSRQFLLAFDKFKDSMTAHVATERARDVIAKHCPDASIHAAPLTDGGEGFCAILTSSAGGELETHTHCGPRFESLEAQIGFVGKHAIPADALNLLNLPETVEKVAIIEMAQAAGIQSVPVDARDARYTTTRGVGQQIQYAIESGADAILLGVGGSATSDFGLGAMAALGFQFFDKDGVVLDQVTPSVFPEVQSVRKPNSLDACPPIRIACDVSNPLLGPHGAAHVFGPQKGLSAEYIPLLDKEVGRIAGLLCAECESETALMETPGAGAAGGIAAGFLIALGAQLVPGFSLVRAWLQLEDALGQTDFLITGEGKWDTSSLDGKGPFAVIEAVKDRSVDVLLVAGALDADAIVPVEKTLVGELHTLELKDSEKTLKENLAAGPERLSALLEKFFSEKSL